jgi:hypothetical protein
MFYSNLSNFGRGVDSWMSWALGPKRQFTLLLLVSFFSVGASLLMFEFCWGGFICETELLRGNCLTAFKAVCY